MSITLPGWASSVFSRLGLLTKHRCYSLAQLFCIFKTCFIFSLTIIECQHFPFSTPNLTWDRLTLFQAGQSHGLSSHKGVIGSLNIPEGSISGTSLQDMVMPCLTLIPSEQEARALLSDFWVTAWATLLWASKSLTSALKGSKQHLASLYPLSKFDFSFWLLLLPKIIFLQWLGNTYDFKWKKFTIFFFSPVQHQKHHSKLETYSIFVSFCHLYIQVFVLLF